MIIECAKCGCEMEFPSESIGCNVRCPSCNSKFHTSVKLEFVDEGSNRDSIIPSEQQGIAPEASDLKKEESNFDIDTYEFLEMKKSKDLNKYGRFFRAAPIGVKVLTVSFVIEIILVLASTFVVGGKIGYGCVVGAYFVGAILKREKWGIAAFRLWRFGILLLAIILFFVVRGAKTELEVNLYAPHLVNAVVDVLASIPAMIAMFLPGISKWANNKNSFKV